MLKIVPLKAKTRATINNETGKKTDKQRTCRDYINSGAIEPAESKIVFNWQETTTKTPQRAGKTQPSWQ